jgi:F0F1-type ATP synthase delta subunit
MTPITAERIVRMSLKAAMSGPGSLESRISEISTLLARLPSSAKRKIASPLKMRLMRALRRKTAIVRTALPVSDEIRKALRQKADEGGMLFFKEEIQDFLLAGFSYQEGDDRTDYSLRNKIRSLI